MAFNLTPDPEYPGLYILTEDGGSTGGGVDEGDSVIVLPGNRLFMIRKEDKTLLQAISKNITGEVVIGDAEAVLTLQGTDIQMMKDGAPISFVDPASLHAVATTGSFPALVNRPLHPGYTGLYCRWDKVGRVWQAQMWNGTAWVWGAVPDPTTLAAAGYTHYHFDSTNDSTADNPPYLPDDALWDTPGDVVPA